MPLDYKDYEDSFVVDRLKNQLISGGTSNLPPRQRGEFRVPFATRFKLVRTQSFLTDKTKFTLTWEEPENNESSPVSQYNIYLLGLDDKHAASQAPSIAAKSPAIITVNTITVLPVTFIIQTQLSNGLTSPIESSPTCTGFSVAHV